MVVDTSALVAVLLGEPRAMSFLCKGSVSANDIAPAVR